ncbi:D-alanyl-D-alanine carboxypeptidase [Streptomyces sp. NPDC058676]|uniref:D-alanyl-D-alanine carboxypeptidase n=1 Tax=unclassified Streptomyces TaxID=2593676 RepID=UPI00364DCBFE
MEEASVAGESPDRSKKRESSAEPTSGSAGPVPEARTESSQHPEPPEKRDPRLAVARDSGTTSTARGGVDTATRVFSVRELTAEAQTAGETPETAEETERAEEPVQDAVKPRTGDTGADGAGEAAQAATEAEADAADATEPETDTAASTTAASTTGASAAEPGEATKDSDEPRGEDAGEGAQDPEATPPGGASRDATKAKTAGQAADPRVEDARAPKAAAGEGAQDAATAEGAAADAQDEDADVEGSSADTGSGAADDRDEARAAGDARLRDAVAAWVASADEKAEDAEAGSQEPAPDGAEAETDADADQASDAGTDSPEAGAGTEAKADDTPKAEAGSTRKADDTPKAEAGSKADDTAQATPDDEPTPDAEAKTDTKTETGSKADSEPTPEADDTPKPQAGSKDGGAAQVAAGDGPSSGDGEKAGDEAEPEAGASTAADEGPEAGVDADAEQAPASAGDRSKSAASKDAKATDADEPAESGKADEADGDAKPSVDQPTAVFKVRPPAPAVDQPTTMLKLGDAAKTPEAPEAPAERTSKFVALKPLDDSATRKTAPADATSALPQVGPERTTQQPLPPRPPLDLLAELTNTPPPPETPVRTIVRRVKIWTPLVLLLAVVFAIVQAVRPLPAPELTLTADESYTFEGSKANLPWPSEGQGRMDVNGIGTMGDFGKQTPVAIGSVAKAMTAYVVLKDHPLKSGAEGPNIPVDATAEKEGGYDKDGESTLNTIKEGDNLTLRQAITAIMIPSANNVARLLARWDADTEAAFIKKMNDAAKDLGMKNTTYTDASGLKETTVSTAEDQVKLGNELVKMPALMEITSMGQWIDPSGQKWYNYNYLVPYNGAIGIKTGTTTAAGGNLLFAARKEVGGETVTLVGAILGQHKSPIIKTVNDVSRTAMLAAQDAMTSAKILKKGDVVGYVDDGLGGRTPVVLTKDVTAVGWAGFKVKLSFASDDVPHTAKAGTKVGTLTVGDGAGGAIKVPVALQRDLAEPGYTDKLTRLG